MWLCYVGKCCSCISMKTQINNDGKQAKYSIAIGISIQIWTYGFVWYVITLDNM